jgi:uncharacterized protein (AIM24 family)
MIFLSETSDSFNNQWDIPMLRGGLFNVRLKGSGLVAFTTHDELVTLLMTPENPVVTDPNATVAWSVTWQPHLRVDVSFKTFLGRGNGESVQAEYAGNGFVLMQRHQEVTFQGADAGFGAVFDSAGARKNPLRLATVRSGIFVDVLVMN